MERDDSPSFVDEKKFSQDQTMSSEHKDKDITSSDDPSSASSLINSELDEQQKQQQQLQEIPHPIVTEYQYCDLTKMTLKEYLSSVHLNQEDRKKLLKNWQQEKYTPNEVLKVNPMKWYEEIVMILFFLFAVPGGVFSIPVLIGIVGFFTGNFLKTFMYASFILVPLAIMPVKFNQNFMTSWYTFHFIQYFSFKFVCPTNVNPNEPHILVAPPHGVFPFGNIVTIFTSPVVGGFYFHGLTSSIALFVPFFRQFFKLIGVIDASRESATKVLKQNKSIGISTGGVAEVFETNSKTGDEVVVLKSRQGLVKLAMRTGASLVPCYLFGNTQLYSVWYGDEGTTLREIIRSISRKIGFALIVFWGRFFLPVPYRIPIFGVMDEPIRVVQKDNPTDEEVERVHQLLMDRMVALFDKHKSAYGWGNKRLIVR